MNKIILTILLILVVALSACSTTTTTTNEDGTTTQVSGTIGDDDGSVNFNGTSSIKDLMKSEKALHCTFSEENSTNENAFSQEIYMDKERVYIKMDMQTDDKMTIYSIDDGEYTYTWNSNSKKGMKMKSMKEEDYIGDDEEFNDSETGNYNLNGEDEEGVKMDAELNYNCEAWKAKNSQFVPPKDIEFVDLASMVEGLTGLEGLGDMFN